MLGEGHECVSHLMPYSSYRPAMYSVTTPCYDIMRNTCTPDGWDSRWYPGTYPLADGASGPTNETSCIDKKRGSPQIHSP
jgi:hypothetical protein